MILKEKMTKEKSRKKAILTEAKDDTFRFFYQASAEKMIGLDYIKTEIKARKSFCIAALKKQISNQLHNTIILLFSRSQTLLSSM